MLYSIGKKETLTGRAIGVLSGAGACFTWMMAIWFPASELKLTGINLIAGYLCAGLLIWVKTGRSGPRRNLGN